MEASLILMDIPVRLPLAIDLILVPALFFLLYTLAILLYPIRGSIPRGRELVKRVGAAFSALFLLLTCLILGGGISWLLMDYLPRGVRNGLESLGMNADIQLPGFKPAHLHGNAIALLCLFIGLLIAIEKIKKAPAVQRSIPLTPEQRMTPYQRMIREKREQQKAPSPNPPGPKRTPAPAASPKPTKPKPAPAPAACHNQPLPTLRPEAVNYRPL
jgi:hypothetical protein